MEYEWVYLAFARRKPGEVHYWKLIEPMFLLTAGTLVRGSRRNQGWHVRDAVGNPIAVLPTTLSCEEAKDAAKLLILLSLKQSEESL